MRIRYRDGRRFAGARCRESSEPLANPGCGWYHVYTFAAQPPSDGRPVREETWLDEECQKEQLALVLIDIGSYRTEDIPRKALDHIEEILIFFRQQHKQMILRFAYDIRGEALMREPADITQVKRHMGQLGSILCRYAQDILVIQGILVGNWGEMHGSRFLNEDSMCSLVHTWYRAFGGRCFLAVRTPAQWRRIMRCGVLTAGMKDKLALFDDGIFGSPTDLGTYGAEDLEASDAEGRWAPQAELRWQERYMDIVPNGGEVLPGCGQIGYRQAAERMRRMHLSYLNGIYHQDRLNVWQNETVHTSGCWQGVSGYDYIGRHLGYRFVVREVKKKGGQLKITVENTGFASLCEEAECYLVTEAKGREIGCRDILTDARHWRSGQKVVLSVDLPRRENPAECYEWGRISCGKQFRDSMPGENLRFYLWLKRRSDGRSIRFANQGARDKVLLGEFGKYSKI